MPNLKNSFLRIRPATRAKIDRLVALTRLTISEQIDVLVDAALTARDQAPRQPPPPFKPPSADPNVLPLVKLGPGGDFVREITPEDLEKGIL